MLEPANMGWQSSPQQGRSVERSSPLLATIGRSDSNIMMAKSQLSYVLKARLPNACALPEPEFLHSLRQQVSEH
jgi:hypothetical protein